MKTRNLHTKIWNDDWFCELTATEKLLFVYLLTNKEVNLNGVYELSDRVILFETGVSREHLEKAKESFKNKILIENGWVIIKNVEKYDDYKGGILTKAKENQLKDIPKEVMDRANEYRNTPSIPPIEGVREYPYSNSTSNSNSKEKGIVKGENILQDIDLDEIAEKYQVPRSFVVSKLDDMENWCKANGKRYKDKKAALMNWVKKDAIEIRQKAAQQQGKVAVQT
jgi:hypothetical protein